MSGGLQSNGDMHLSHHLSPFPVCDHFIRESLQSKAAQQLVSSDMRKRIDADSDAANCMAGNEDH